MRTIGWGGGGGSKPGSEEEEETVPYKPGKEGSPKPGLSIHEATNDEVEGDKGGRASSRVGIVQGELLESLRSYEEEELLQQGARPDVRVGGAELYSDEDNFFLMRQHESRLRWVGVGYDRR